MSTTIRYVEREGGVYRQYTKESWATRTFVEFDVEDCRTVYDAPSFDFLPSLFFFIIFVDDRPQLWPRFGGANWCRAPMSRETRNKSDILLHLRSRDPLRSSLSISMSKNIQKISKKYKSKVSVKKSRRRANAIDRYKIIDRATSSYRRIKVSNDKLEHRTRRNKTKRE